MTTPHNTNPLPETPQADYPEVPLSTLKYVGGGYYRENLPEGEVGRTVHGIQMLERTLQLETRG